MAKKTSRFYIREAPNSLGVIAYLQEFLTAARYGSKEVDLMDLSTVMYYDLLEEGWKPPKGARAVIVREELT